MLNEYYLDLLNLLIAKSTRIKILSRDEEQIASAGSNTAVTFVIFVSKTSNFAFMAQMVDHFGRKRLYLMSNNSYSRLIKKT